MSNLEKISVGIRDSKLSHAQTNIFLKEAQKIEKLSKNFFFDVRTIKTSGDIHNTQRLDQIGGKGLFTREIEMKLISGEIDLAVHSMKDLPSQEINSELEIICWLQRYHSEDALISNSGSNFFDLPAGSTIGTSSIRRRSQILSLRKDLSIKLLRGNVDTRIQKLINKEYDAIILSKAGLDRLNLSHLITEVLDHSHFLPASCQGAVGIQAKRENTIIEHIRKINNTTTECECLAERKLLKHINANCNSPISVFAEILSEKIKISCEVFEHDGNKIFQSSVEGHKDKYFDLSEQLAKKILADIGQEKINKLDNLENDFNYKAI